MSWKSPILLSIFVMTCSGCLADQVARDGSNLRTAILEIYTDQIMDNLVRAKTGQPFVQLTFSTIQVQDVDSLSGTAENTNTYEQTTNKNAPAVLATLAYKLTNAMKLSSTAKRDRTMSFKADPVTDKNDIYESYLEFAHNPSYFIASCEDPKCNAHVCVKRCGTYYWVPKEFADAFQQLCMKTTFMRGPETTPPPVYWEREVLDVYVFSRVAEDKTDPDNIIPMRVNAAIKFEAPPIPNVDGSMLAKLDDGRKINLPLQRLDTTIPVDSKVKANEVETQWLKASWFPALTGFDVENIRKVGKVKILLPTKPPPFVTPSTELKKINDNLDSIRLNQLNFRNSN